MISGLLHDHQRAILIDDEVKTKNPKGQHHRGSAPRSNARTLGDLKMVTNEVADTSPDVPAAKRAKILSEDEGNEGGHEIAERVGGEIGAVQPWLAVSNEAGSNGRSGANAPGAVAEKGGEIVENANRDGKDVGAEEPEEEGENPVASPRPEPAANADAPTDSREGAPGDGEKLVPNGDASADAAGAPVEPAKEPEGISADQEHSAGAQPIVAANSADASDPSDAAAPENTLRAAQHAILLRQQAIKYKGCCQVDDCLNPRKQPTANSRMPLTCAEHNGMLSLPYGGEASRECQACRAFHPVSAFDRDNKTCETRLLRKKLRYRAKTLQQRDEHRGNVGKKAKRNEVALQAVAAAAAQAGGGADLSQFGHLRGPGGFVLPFGGKFPGVADNDGGVGALAAARESIMSTSPYGVFPGFGQMPFGQSAVEGAAAAAASAFAANFGTAPLGADDNKLGLPQHGGINLQSLAGFPTRSNPTELASPAAAQAYLAALVQGNTGVNALQGNTGLNALALQGAGLPGGIPGLAGLQNPDVLAILAQHNNVQEQVAALRANHMLRMAQAAEMQASAALTNSRSTGGDVLNRQNLYPHLARDQAQAGCSIM